jgi:cyclic pyranopterin phosphate synthase
MTILSKPELIDSFGRTIDYLRVSLTDACNFRCVYCVSPGSTEKIESNAILTRDEILRFVGLASSLGVRRIRLTGGEPLLRADILDIVRSIKAMGLIEDLSITTNGSRLRPLLKPLKEAGLDRLNISLDALEPVRFKKITLSDAFFEVESAFYEAVAMGFPVKLNVVAVKGLTYQEVLKFASIAQKYPVEVRFLEFMPLCGEAWDADLVIPVSAIKKICEEHLNLIPDEERGNRVAETYCIEGGQGKIGFIGSLTESFCDQCSRIRITADGKIKPCLFSDVEVSVGELLKNGASDDAILQALRQAAAIKPAGNMFHEEPFNAGTDYKSNGKPLTNVVMKGVGG